MTEEQATAVAKALGGTAWQSGGNIWLVMFYGKSGSLVVISEDAVCEYADQAAFDAGQALQLIALEHDPAIARA